MWAGELVTLAAAFTLAMRGLGARVERCRLEHLCLEHENATARLTGADTCVGLRLAGPMIILLSISEFWRPYAVEAK